MDHPAQRRIHTLTRHLDSTTVPSLHSSLQLLECCGIIGYVGSDSAVPYLIDGIKLLQNRGYDSAGICTIDPSSAKRLVVTKFASYGTTSDAIDRLLQSTAPHDGHSCGIAHTRWATHGAKTDVNAHPHTDMYNRFAVIHNGVIENSDALKNELIRKGVKFVSETDTEVIAQLIGYYAKNDNLPALEAVQKTLGRLEGTWGLVIIDGENPNQLIAAKNGSPILIGISSGRMFVASEPTAFSQHTKEFISLENGEIAVISNNGHSLDRTRIELAHDEPIITSPEPYKHWTLKEIYEQPLAISRSLNYGGRIQGDDSVKLGGLEDKSSLLKSVKHLVISACGTSYYASCYGALLMRFLNSFDTIQVFDASELTRESLPRKSSAFLVLSQSGETKDVARALEIADELSIPSFSIVNAVRSLVARTTRCGVYLNAGREVAVASTKAFSCQITVLSLVAIWFSQQKGTDIQRRRLLIESLHRLPTNFGMTINKVHSICKSVAVKINKANHLFILGKGYGEPIAREGSLKIKEISYLHAEGYPGGALKHGPFAMIEEKTPIILIILSDSNASLMKTVAAEVKARHAHVIIITDIVSNEMSSLGEDVIYIPNNGPLTALLAIIPLQLIAYELALLRGINPDKPRHLAKAVTVD